MKHPQFELHADIEERHWWFLGRRRIMRELARRVVPPSRLATVVDVGCGTGGNIAALADDYRCVGIDTSREAIQLARGRFPGIQFIRGSAPADLGAIGREADLFLLMDVLEHVKDDFALLAELLSAARPGAHLLLTVPADPTLWSAHDVSFGHYRRYRAGQLARLWSGLPVTARLLSCYNSRLYPIVKAMRAVSRLRGRAGGRAGTDFSMPWPPINALLERVLAGEAGLLADVLEAKRASGFPFGVSLVAVLRREPGEIAPRKRPHDAPPDFHQPETSHEP